MWAWDVLQRSSRKRTRCYTGPRWVFSRCSRAGLSLAASVSSDATEQPKGSGLSCLDEVSGLERRTPELVRRSAAVCGIWEHVVDCEDPPVCHFRRPTVEVRPRRLAPVTAVDEAEVHRRAPMCGDGGGVADHPDDGRSEACTHDRPPPEREGVYAAGLGVDDLTVVMVPPRLILL